MAKSTTETIFSKIIRKEIPAKIVYEDDICLCFHDIHPVAPIHLLLIPKKPIAMLSDSEQTDTVILGHLLQKVAIITQKLNIQDAFRVVVNNGAGACQTVMHLHLHILSGRAFNWPPG